MTESTLWISNQIVRNVHQSSRTKAKLLFFQFVWINFCINITVSEMKNHLLVKIWDLKCLKTDPLYDSTVSTGPFLSDAETSAFTVKTIVLLWNDEELKFNEWK